MDRSNVIKLIKQSFTVDQYGVQRPTETYREVFCQVDSVSLDEWSQGGRLGNNPEYRFRLWSFEYEGEQIVEFENRRYTVYRTYTARDHKIELYCERREGNATSNQA